VSRDGCPEAARSLTGRKQLNSDLKVDFNQQQTVVGSGIIFGRETIDI
jgi:hypothetical protein